MHCILPKLSAASNFADKRWYKGGLDSAVVPYAIADESAANHIRVGFEHKQSQKDKDIYTANHGLKVCDPAGSRICV